jgi:hypothetical protein
MITDEILLDIKQTLNEEFDELITETNYSEEFQELEYGDWEDDYLSTYDDERNFND